MVDDAADQYAAVLRDANAAMSPREVSAGGPVSAYRAIS
jgi:hypothetical protein